MKITEKEYGFMQEVVNHGEFGEPGCLDNTPWSWAVCETKSRGALLGSLVAKGLAHQNGKGRDASCGLTKAGKEAYIGHFGTDGLWSHEKEVKELLEGMNQSHPSDNDIDELADRCLEPVDKANRTAEFLERGIALAIMELAEHEGETVEAIVTTRIKLAGAGLPEKIDGNIARLAHRLHRDRIDATMFRCNRPLNEEAPVLSQQEADTIDGEVKRPLSKKAEKRVERIQEIMDHANNGHKKEKPCTMKTTNTVPVKTVGGETTDGENTVENLKEKKTRGRYFILGHSLTRVLVWMGQHHWTKERAQKVLDHFEVHCSPLNVSITVKRGAEGTATSHPAELTKKDIKQLEAIK